jgi:CRISP-associated protein Cas1
MIKKTLYFGSPAYLSCKQEQLIIDFRQEQFELNFVDYTEKDDRYDNRKKFTTPSPGAAAHSPSARGRQSIPIEDIGVIIIDHYGVVISQYLINSLLENNAAVVVCNAVHHPTGLFLNLSANTTQSEKFKAQIEASLPLKKQMWQQTVKAKIENQALLLQKMGIQTDNMLKWVKDVKAGDTGNHEARAAAFYWKAIFAENIDFYRSRTGPPPNNLLNYAYAILRAITARALAGSGLLPTLGIHHRNKYNAYCLADDIMEPYRPFVDRIVCEVTDYGKIPEELTPLIKKRLLEIASTDIYIKKEKSPLMVGMQRTTASVARVFESKTKKLLYPELI